MTQKVVETVTDAMEIAREVAQKAGLGFFVVINVKRDGAYWLVDLTTLFGQFRVKINAMNGEVVEFGPLK